MKFISELLHENAAGGAVSAGAIAGVRTPLSSIEPSRKIKKRNIKKFAIYHKIVEDKETFDFADTLSKIKAAERGSEKVKDTVVFGLDDEDGNVVKVFVPREQAADFEKTLAAELDEIKRDEGAEIEIAEVLFRMRDKFDIVDVQWPQVVEDEEEDLELDVDAEDELAPEEDDLGVDELDAEAEPEAAVSDEKSILNNVIDMLKAQADAMKAEAEAKKAEAQAREAEMAAKAADAKMKAEEEILDMEDFYAKQAEEERESKELAKLAKYRHDVAKQAETAMATESVEDTKKKEKKSKKKEKKKYTFTLADYVDFARKHNQAQD